MFYYLSGTVAHIEPYLAVIDCGGVGVCLPHHQLHLVSAEKRRQGKTFYIPECP